MSTFLVALFGIALSTTEEESHPASCYGLEDGIHFIRPTPFIGNEINAQDFPSILVRCSHDWIIFDYSLDPNIKHYFSTFMSITDDFASMDIGIQHINWSDWVLLKNLKYSVSPDCNTCDTQNSNEDMAYYMTGNYYGCSFATKSLCDMSPTTLQCNQCSGLINDDKLYNGLCTHIILDINDENINNALTSHQKCVTAKWNYLPSIGMNGQFCPCFKPNTNKLFKIRPNIVTKVIKTVENVPNCDRVIELVNDDFKHGTYRIRECGTYILMEDIALNMNAPNIDYYGSPNDNNYWWPTAAQQKELYPSNNFIGAYAMGFFAGIVVESDNVIIDLNGFELQMHLDFYIQQRFFSLIELGSKPFVSGQGPVNFGNENVKYPSNVVIKNGKLGLTSHHCIHGNNNRNLHIFDIDMYDFEVSGIALNGFTDLRIENVNIGPNYQNIPISPSYAHGRFMLQRLEMIENDSNDKFVIINNENIFLTDIIDTLRDEMDSAFAFAHNIDTIDAKDEIYNNIFVNSDGLAHGGTLYGIFLNSEGASVFGLGLSPGHSTNAVLKDINIRQLRSAPMENVRAQLQRGPFNDLLDIKKIIKFDKDNNAIAYKGTSYSNAQYALIKLVSDQKWSVLGHSFINKQVLRWIERGAVNKGLKVKFKCNSDIMLHLTKGIFGIRIDNVKGVAIKGYLNIEHLHNLGAFGETELCGQYYNARTGGHHNQLYPEQIGYTGNEVHGMTMIGCEGSIDGNSNVFMNDLVSLRGSVFGINFYNENEMRIEKYANVMVSNVYSGAHLKESDYAMLGLPNVVPRTCVIDIWLSEGNKIEIDRDANVESACVTNYEKCSFEYSLIDSKKYNKENEILNRDFMRHEINNNNNENCDRNLLANDNNALVGWSKISEYHLETLRLAEMQTKGEENNSIFYACMYVLLGVTLSVTICLCLPFRNKRRRHLQPQIDDRERYPLIA